MVVASFPVDPNDQIMMVTDGGQLIRCPVDDIRIAGRQTQGVTLFRTAVGEAVVSVAHLPNENGDDDELDDETAAGSDDGGVPGDGSAAGDDGSEAGNGAETAAGPDDGATAGNGAAQGNGEEQAGALEQEDPDGQLH